MQRNGDIDGPHNNSYTQNNYITGSDKLNEPFADYKDDATAALTQNDPRIITPPPDMSHVDIKDSAKTSLDDKLKKIHSQQQQRVMTNNSATASGQQPNRMQNLMVGINRLQIQKKH